MFKYLQHLHLTTAPFARLQLLLQKFSAFLLASSLNCDLLPTSLPEDGSLYPRLW
jgi:hypothetical protein